jgi:PKD repeat protein
MALVWDWGDGNKTTSWFPATHRYTANGEFTVTVTVVGCHTFSLVTTAEIDNAATPGCPPVGVQTHYYLVPYNIHLTAGTTSAVPLDVVDQDGNSVSGALTFEVSGPQDLVSVSEYGYVTALREENPEGEAGIWINALLDGHPSLANKAVVRVLPAEYDIPVFTEALGERTGLCYPTSVNGQDIAAWVSQFEIPVVNEYSYQIQSRLMGTSPFDGGRQFFEVDLGITESNRVCGISGNPIRLGWNTAGDPWNPWQNCFLVPFPVWDPPPPLSPQWGVFYHELGHNMTWASSAFATGLGNLRPVGTFDLYSEGFASAIELAAINEITGYPEKYPLENDATLSMQWIYDRDASQFTNKRQEWLSGGATFSTVDPDTVDGIWLHHGAGVPHFADRFFLPLQPLMIEHLGEVLCQVQAGGDDAKHTFFAALVSAAAGTDLFDTFAGLYHYPIMPDLYESARTAFSGIIAQRECPGDFNKDGSSNAADLAVFAVDFGKTGCSVSSCNGDFNTDGDVDGSELAAFISKFGRADCL